MLYWPPDNNPSPKPVTSQFSRIEHPQPAPVYIWPPVAVRFFSLSWFYDIF